MILVIGATGNVGRELVDRLLADHQAVRAMSRRPSTALLPPGVEVVYGDCDDPAGLDAVFRGVDRAFLMSAQVVGTAEGPTHDLALVAAARRAGVDHLVKLSVYDGGESDDPLGAWHRAAEAAVTGSGVAWTMLRPGRFMSNTRQWAPMIARGGAVPIPFADRASAAVDPADIAEVARLALTGSGHRGATYQLSGPQTRTPAAELKIIGEVIGRPVSYVEPSIETFRGWLLHSGMPAAVADAVISRTAEGTEGNEVLATVPEVLGRPATDFPRWAARHAATFGAAPGDR